MKKIVLILIVLLCTSCSNKPLEHSSNLYYMDTLINIKIYTTNSDLARKAIREAENIYSEYHKLTNYYDNNSHLTYINQTTGEITIDERVYELIQFGYNWYNESNGLLNINIGKITKFWHDFREGLVTLDDLNKVKNTDISITNIILKDNNKIINNGFNIDLGAIAKGYVTEIVGEYFESIGLEYYIINAGGNVKVGKKYEGEYLIGITSPIDTSDIFMTIKGEDISVVTSGSYERFYEVGDTLYHHIIDPKTFYPANYMKSVTIIGEDSGVCDALSTILFLMPIEEGKEFIKKYDVEAIWFTNDNQIVKSEGITKYE